MSDCLVGIKESDKFREVAESRRIKVMRLRGEGFSWYVLFVTAVTKMTTINHQPSTIKREMHLKHQTTTISNNQQSATIPCYL
jgi:hypothetical protein